MEGLAHFIGKELPLRTYEGVLVQVEEHVARLVKERAWARARARARAIATLLPVACPSRPLEISFCLTILISP